MKTLFAALLFCALPLCAAAQLSDVPDAPDVDAKYIIYLHGGGVERLGMARADEDARGAVKALQGKGFVVISEERSAGAKVNEFGKKVAGQVAALIAKGVPPEHITVAGYSKGGLIALWAAVFGNNPKVNYVLLAGCVMKGSEHYPTYANNVARRLKGRMLSMYDAADPDRGTCKEFFDTAGGRVVSSEIRFETGSGHGLFRNVTDQWLNPLADWANGKDPSRQ